MNEWVRSRLVCPRDKEKLEDAKNALICPKKHVYPIIEDIPVMLIEEVEENHHHTSNTFREVSEYRNGAYKIRQTEIVNGVDDYVQREIPHTSGTIYLSLQNVLTRYPIPELRLPNGGGKTFLDVGCNWGRWSFAALQKNFRVVGVDVSLKACLAAKRVARQLNAETDFIVADARFLPFAADSFDTAYSALVLQCFSKPNMHLAFDEISRTVKTNGTVLIQMANKYGVLALYRQLRRGWREAEKFEVRYWTPAELKRTFEEKFGETLLTAECFFGQGMQASDVDLLPPKYKMMVNSSEFIKKISRLIKPLTKFADSVYLESINEKN